MNPFEQVTLDTILGAACVYILAGLSWTYVYDTILLFDANSICFTASSESGDMSPLQPFDFAETAYFSFVTMTTTGYGDIAPISALARTAANIQAIFGQFFLAIIVARLVALQVAQHVSREDK